MLRIPKIFNYFHIYTYPKQVSSWKLRQCFLALFIRTSISRIPSRICIIPGWRTQTHGTRNRKDQRQSSTNRIIKTNRIMRINGCLQNVIGMKGPEDIKRMQTRNLRCCFLQRANDAIVFGTCLPIHFRLYGLFVQQFKSLRDGSCALEEGGNCSSLVGQRVSFFFQLFLLFVSILSVF